MPASVSPVQLRALGYRTELMLLSVEGRILDRGDYIVIETPGNPAFYWGNLLLFRQPPGPGDDRRWPALFRQEFASSPEVRHFTFGWDSPEGARGAVEFFLEAGFELDENIVLTASSVQLPPRFHEGVEVRPLHSDRDWEAALENQLAAEPESERPERFLEFKQRQVAKFRRMAEAGWGDWYGAFLDGRLVADCGLYTDGEVGRYQEVQTHPDFRRRGICGALVYHTARRALEAGVRQLVMVADEGYHAARIYQSIGFRPAERMIGLLRRPGAGQGEGGGAAAGCG